MTKQFATSMISSINILWATIFYVKRLDFKQKLDGQLIVSGIRILKQQFSICWDFKLKE